VALKKMKNDPLAGAQLKKNEAGEFELSGELSFQTVPALSGRIHQLLTNKTHLVVKLTGVLRSDSAGVALLVDWLRQAQQHDVSLQFTDMPAQMHAIAAVSGLDEILPVVAG